MITSYNLNLEEPRPYCQPTLAEHLWQDYLTKSIRPCSHKSHHWSFVPWWTFASSKYWKTKRIAFFSSSFLANIGFFQKKKNWKKREFLRFFKIFQDFRIFWPFLKLLKFYRVLWIFFGHFLDIFWIFFRFFLDFLDFFGFLDFLKFLNFFGFFCWIFLVFSDSFQSY